MVASVPFDWQAHDSYFVVAHFHYVLIGGVVFPLFAGLYYWLPKVTGRLLDERLGRWNFWLMFVFFNVAFFPMHLSGLLGMPRRVYTYPAGLGLETLQPHFHHRRVRLRARDLTVRRQCVVEPQTRKAGGQQSVGRRLAGVVGSIAPAGCAVRADPGGPQQVSVMGTGGPASP